MRVWSASVIDWLEKRDDIDATRIGIWGISLGGYYAPRSAAFEKRIKACIANCGPYNWGALWDALPELTKAAYVRRSHSKPARPKRRRRLSRLNLKAWRKRSPAQHSSSPAVSTGSARPRTRERLASRNQGPVELLVIEDGNHVAHNRVLQIPAAVRGLDGTATGCAGRRLIRWDGHSGKGRIMTAADDDAARRSNFKPHIHYDDLREWLSEADRLGEVRRVSGASWQEDIGLAAEAVLREENGPCVVFDEVPGCPKGHRLLLNMFAGTRRNMTLGFPDHLTKWELSNSYRDAYLTNPKIVPHEIVEDGPVLENILTGDDIDVSLFPSPIWHEKDGGRYIGTGTYSITRDPEEGWLNAGAYRSQVHDKTSVGILMAAGHHGAIHCDKYFKRGEPMPVAMVLGGDPLAFFYGGIEVPYGTFEFDVVGGIRGRPVKMVRGKVTGLPIPGQCRDRPGGLCHAGQARGRGSVRRMERPLRGRRQTLHCARYQGDLSSQRSDPASACRRWARARTRWRATAR